MAIHGRDFPIRPHLSRSVSRNVTVAVTGVSATASVGTVGVALAIALTGVAATAGVGTVAPSAEVPITGVSVTASAGVASPGVSVTITGAPTTGAVGSVGVQPQVLYAKAAGGNWSSASTWSLVSSAGTDSAGPPDATYPYDVILDAGSGNVTINANASCRSLNCTGYTGVLTHNTGVQLAVGHITPGPSNVALKFVAGMTYTPASTSAIVVVSAGSGTTQTVQTAGKSLGALTVNGAGSAVLADALVVTGNIILSAGSFSTGNFTVTALTVTISGAAVTFGSSTINLTRTTTGNVFQFASGSVNAGTSNIVILNPSTNVRTFAGGGQTYFDVTDNVAGSTGGFTITGANTFHSLSFNDISNARTLTLPSSVTTVATNFLVSGTAGKKMSVRASSSGTPATLSIASGTVSSDHVDIKDSTAIGGASFFAGSNSIDSGGNTGWSFTAAGDQPITGVSATGAAGNVGVSVSVAVTGVSATGSAGNVSVGSDVVVSITGVSAVASAGNVGVSQAVAVTGVAATGGVGTVAPSLAVVAVGVAATGVVGSVSTQGVLFPNDMLTADQVVTEQVRTVTFDG